MGRVDGAPVTHAVGDADMRRKPFPNCHCGPLSANCVTMQCERLAAASRLPGEVRLNQRVQGVGGDLAVDNRRLRRRNRAVRELFCGVGGGECREGEKYQPLADALRGRCYVVHVDGFVVGALDAWHPNNDVLGSFLRVSKRYASFIRLLIVSETIAWPRDMYIEHVSGIRQYFVLDAAAPVTAAPESTPAIVSADDGGVAAVDEILVK